MRTSTILAALSFALAPSFTQAKGKLGFSLGEKKTDGSCKFTADYLADFDAIKSATGSTIVRGYSASSCNTSQQILPAAKQKGFKVVLGAWPDTDASLAADMAALQTYVQGYTDQVYAVTVGSETLYRGNFTGAELVEKINQVRGVLPHGVKVGTADSWNRFADGTADAVIRGGVDIILANGFAYWQAEPIENATYTYFQDVQQALARVQDISGSVDAIEFWNGETGWPSDGGSSYGAAIASTKNAATYWDQAVCAMLGWGTNVFSFEAFDEPWKPKSVGTDGTAADETHWGVMNSDRSSKFSLKC